MSEGDRSTARGHPFLIWLLLAAVIALAVARVSVWIQPHFAPLGLYPLLIGAGLGALLCGLTQITGVTNLRRAVAGTLAAVLIASAAEHAFFYLDRTSEYWRRALAAGVPPEVITPKSFVEYMRDETVRSRWQVPLWAGNAVLMAIAAGSVVIWASKVRGDPARPGSNNPLEQGKLDCS
jgi:hypothetical protein